MKTADSELVEALRAYVALYPAFRSKPVGAPGSAARAEQDVKIAWEDKAKSLIAAAEENKR